MLFDFSNIKIDSPYNIGISVDSNAHPALRDYLTRRFQTFLNDTGLHQFFLKELLFTLIFTDVEFNKQVPDDNEESFINKHFYPKVFHDLRKLENGKLDFTKKYCFTLDKSLTLEKTSSGIQYGTLSLGNKPVLYYIWVDIQELIQILK